MLAALVATRLGLYFGLSCRGLGTLKMHGFCWVEVKELNSSLMGEQQPSQSLTCSSLS